MGKTVQVLALLAYILDNHGTRGKHLIVAPLSTLSSWRDHFADWLPALNVYLHRGPAAERKEKLIAINKGENNVDAVVSTYQMVIRDKETMSQIKWNYLIVDEAHTFPIISFLFIVIIIIIIIFHFLITIILFI